VNGTSGSLQGIDEGLDGWARRISTELCAVLLDTLGLRAALEWHVRRFQKSTGVLYQLEVNDAAGFELPEECAATIFDVYRLALLSIARHTQPSRIAIALTITPREVTMLVRDGGRGSDDAASAAAAVTVSLPIPRLPVSASPVRPISWRDS
jgi:signal transduction histidine kinase